MINIVPGMCLYLTAKKNQSRHLYVVLTAPAGNPPTVAIANMTSTNIPDKTVVLEVGDHSFVRKTSYINYAQATVVTVLQLQNILAQDPADLHREDCKPELLERIRRGIFESEFTIPKVQEYCRGKF